MNRQSGWILLLLVGFTPQAALACCGIGLPDLGISKEVVVAVIIILVVWVVLSIDFIAIKVYKKLTTNKRLFEAKILGVAVLILNFVALFPVGVLMVIWLYRRYADWVLNHEKPN